MIHLFGIIFLKEFIMRAYKKISTLLFLILNFVILSSFSLSDVNQLSSEPTVTKEVVELEEIPPLFMDESVDPGEYNYWHQFFKNDAHFRPYLRWSTHYRLVFKRIFEQAR